MWHLNAINYRNKALASQLTPVEVGFLSVNTIYPVVGYKLSKQSIERIKAFKEEQLEIDNGRCRK